VCFCRVAFTLTDLYNTTGWSNGGSPTTLALLGTNNETLVIGGDMIFQASPPGQISYLAYEWPNSN
jgi:hypothetical protein